jgi:hypothetical protein
VASALRDDAPVGVVHELPASTPPKAPLELARPAPFRQVMRWLERVLSAVRGRLRTLLASGQRPRSA